MISVETFGVRGAIGHSYDRLRRSLSNHGLRGTLERAFRKAPPAPEVEQLRPADPFDQLHGTDTSGKMTPSTLPGVSQSALYLTAYIGVPYSSLTEALSHLPLQPADFTFVDLGCGKGRALLVAAQFPFRRILGVELAANLCAVAQANIASKPEWASHISVLNQDAATVTFPEGPLLIFLFNPFFAPVLRRVLANLESQLRRAPRETYVLYAANPRFKVLTQFPFLREVSEATYSIDPEEAAADRFNGTETSFTLYAADLNR